MSKKQYHYVYLTTNLINGKQYVGDHTINPKLKKYYLGSGSYYKNAENYYGKENFFKEILEWFDTRIEAFNAQEKYIIKFDTLQPNGYNISPKGGCMCGPGCHSEESKRKNSESHKGKKHSKEHNKKISESNKGKTLGTKHTIEQNKKISKSHKEGKKLSQTFMIKYRELREKKIKERKERFFLKENKRENRIKKREEHFFIKKIKQKENEIKKIKEREEHFNKKLI
jgi:hypothetical protein